MTYRPVAPDRIWFLLPPHECIVRAARRLYAQYETGLMQEEKERDMAWLGMLLCLAGSVPELALLRWLIR